MNRHLEHELQRCHDKIAAQEKEELMGEPQNAAIEALEQECKRLNAKLSWMKQVRAVNAA